MGLKGIITKIPESGKIKIGGKGAEIKSSGGTKFRPPTKFKHFVITTTERDDAGDYIVDTDLMEQIKDDESGIFNEDGKMIGIPITLPFDNIESNFRNGFASYGPAGLTCYGDNEKSYKKIKNFDPEQPSACPCTRIDPGYSGKDKCKYFGEFTCMIETELLGRVHTFRTTSKNSVLGILGGLEFIRTITRGKLAGIPLMLIFTQKATRTAGGIPTTIPVVTICFRGSQQELRDKTLKLMAEESQFLLSMDEIEPPARALGKGISDEDEKEIQEEYFPGTVVMDANSTAGDTAKKAGGSVDKKEVPEEDEIQPNANEQSNVIKVGNFQKEVPEEETGGPSGEDIIKDQEGIKAVSPEQIVKLKIQTDLVERLNKETDTKKAFALSKRINSRTLMDWVMETYVDTGIIEPDSLPPETGQKPKWLELVKNLIDAHGTNPGGVATEETNVEDEFSPERIQARVALCGDDKKKIMLTGFKDRGSLINYLRSTFPDNQIDGTLFFDGIFALGCKLIDTHNGWADTGGREDAVKGDADFSDPGYAWDEGELSTKDQWDDMVALKSKHGIPTDDWVTMVRRYTDADGKPILKAVKFTKLQGDHFITYLEDDDIPF